MMETDDINLTWSWNYPILVIIALWALTIAEDPPLPPGAKPQLNPPKATTVSASAPKQKGKDLESTGTISFDRDLFLLSFRRQAQLELLNCLRRELESGSLLLVGTLDPAGQLRNIRGVGGNLPSCAVPLLVQMRFRQLTAGVPTEGIELKWRVDF